MLSKKNKVGIITVDLTNSDDTLSCVNSISSINQPNFEKVIYLVHNSINTDGLRKKINFKGVRLIKSKKIFGKAAQYNLGIKEALRDNCDHILLVNKDVVISDTDSIKKLLKLNAQISSPVLSFLRGNKIIYDYGGRVDKLFGRVTQYESTFILKNFYPEADYYSGACLFIDSKVFDKIGLFSENYIHYYEDIDFCLRARKFGINLELAPNVIVRQKQFSNNKININKIRTLADSHFRFCLNNLPPMSTPFFLIFNMYLRFKAVSFDRMR